MFTRSTICSLQRSDAPSSILVVIYIICGFSVPHFVNWLLYHLSSNFTWCFSQAFVPASIRTSLSSSQIHFSSVIFLFSACTWIAMWKITSKLLSTYLFFFFILCSKYFLFSLFFKLKCNFVHSHFSLGSTSLLLSQTSPFTALLDQITRFAYVIFYSSKKPQFSSIAWSKLPFTFFHLCSTVLKFHNILEYLPLLVNQLISVWNWEYIFAFQLLCAKF